MRRNLLGLFATVLVLSLASAPAFAQGATATLSGVVVDADGGVIPGATVVVKNNATGVTQTVVTNTTGNFLVPALDAGLYTVTISLSGFKTYQANDVRLLAATPAELKATLEVGSLTETITVRGGTELVQTQSATVQSTISVEQISNLPLVSRNALNYVTFLPGVDTIGGPRNSTVSGLPQNTINISIDGITTGNQLQSGDGFFSLVTPRLDAVEEITVTGAVPGADGGGAGSVQIAFVTRSGTNAYKGTVYHYFRHPSLNTNYFFNKVNGLDKNRVIVHQYGGSAGGPIVVPGLFDGRGKAFFFFNYEHFFQPTEVTRNRTILTPNAEAGTFEYIAGGQNRTVNLLALAAQNGQISTVDPTIQALLANVRSSTGTTGLVTQNTDPHTMNYVYQAESRRNEYAPTGRVDFQLSTAHRLTGTYYWQRFISNPDILNSREPRYPGFANFGTQTSYRTTGSVTLRSTLGANFVNELKGGWQWSPVDFFTNVTGDQFADQNDLGIDVPLMTDFWSTSGPSNRNTVNYDFENTLSWLKGNHNFNFGGTYTRVNHDQNNWTVVPTAVIGLDTNNDPARTMFNTTNFPGASTGQLNNARALYALLTGRVTAINAAARLSADTNEYVYNGFLNQKSRLEEMGFWAQDSWRVTPTLTLNYGVRYELQLPFKPITTNWSSSTLADLCGISGVGEGPEGRQCNLFQPGTIGAPGVVPQYIPYELDTRGYDTDYNNFAPNVGVAWRPNVQDGFLRRVLGDPEQATLRAGYSVSYNRERMDRFTGLYGGNPGGTITTNRNVNNGNLVLPGESWPLLISQPDRLGPPAFNTTPEYPITAQITAGNDINIFAPDIEVPFTRSWSIGFQRSLSQDMAVEVRYVGNRNEHAWTTENWNELVIFENGFLDEFRAAQQNLLSHVAAGCGAGSAVGTCSFAYRGAGTNPLPTYLAFFSGSTDVNNPAAYSSGNFTNSAWTGHLGQYEPDPYDAANDLWNSATFRNNATAAGVSRNFFQLNPDVDNANITKSLAGSRYHALQVDVRRRLSQGLLLNVNYTYAQRFGSNLQTLRLPRFYLRSDGTSPHVFKANWVYQVPVGRGKRFGTDMNPWLDGFLGNWEFSGTGRVQWELYSAGPNMKLVGMTIDELADNFKIRQERNASGTLIIYDLPQDIIDNTRRAFNTDPTSPTGYSADGAPTGRYIAPASGPGCIALFSGDCGAPDQIQFQGPAFTRFDFRLKKVFPLGGRANAEVNIEVLNVFDNINFNHNFNPGGGATIFQVTSAYTDINTTYDPGGRIGQIVWRVNF